MATHNSTPAERALEVFARGYADSRDGALDMVLNDPAFVASLLAIPPGPEMRHSEDRADPREWGGVG